MKTQISKKKNFIIIAIGLLCVSLGTMLNHFGVIGDGFTGFLMGIGLGLEIVALIKAKKNQQCGMRFS